MQDLEDQDEHDESLDDLNAASELSDTDDGTRGRDRLRDRSDVRVYDMVSAGHGFTVASVERIMSADSDGNDVEAFDVRVQLPTSCRYCGDELPLGATGEWFCEFQELPFPQCRCNWCVIRRTLPPRNRGGQPKACRSVECQKMLARDKKRRQRSAARVRRQAHSVTV